MTQQPRLQAWVYGANEEGALKGRNNFGMCVPRIVTPFQGSDIICFSCPGLRCRSSLGYCVAPFQGSLKSEKTLLAQV
jgi:hypothetical protein